MTCTHDFEAGEREGHILRSQMLDQFVSIEQWAVKTTAQLGKPPSSASFGQRLKLIRKSKESFRHPQRIDKLCGDMEGLIKLRNNLVHAQLDCLIRKSGEHIWRFRNIATADTHDQGSTLLLEKSEFDSRISAIKKLTKELGDQKLRAVTPQKD